ncbi:response regulator transcription factor [Paenibacillus doosanensis]|uniref:response regulator transcription factor n=1 Tax=Paenibacillus doosanensis TaxID=1229154 RepID=UPI00217F2C48|nr:response regulator transcription factor [Paenibacillus doosanensis]MCS7463711.1 response regulator transcription factor [Paenibacillus doosanensis]
MSQATIIIADDQPLIRDGLAAILGMEDEYKVVARTVDGLSTMEQVELHRPQLVLMDIHMPKLDGLEATKRIKAEYPDTKVLILTTFEDEQYIMEAIRYGASGYLVKGVETQTIISTVQDCLDGRMTYPLSIQKRLVQALQSSEQREKPKAEESGAGIPSAADRQHDDKPHSLTVQERNIVRELKKGKSNQAIASELFLTTGTVKNYLSVIYKKLNVAGRSEAIAYLHKHDL